MLISVIAFLVAMGVLIAIHEYGHFQMARWCGVKVLRFSVGFGRPLLRWQKAPNTPEFVLGLLPLGGYVRMLDEREGTVSAHERHLAFNTQPVWKRFVIVLAGPVANLLLAVVLYAAVAWHGMEQLAPVLAQPPAHSLAAQAGVQGRDVVTGLRRSSQSEMQLVQSLDQLRWLLAQAALDHEDVWLHVQTGRTASSDSGRDVFLPLAQAGFMEAGADLFEQIGISAPWMEPVIGEVLAGEAASIGGLQSGDVVTRVENVDITDAVQLGRMVQAHHTPGVAQTWIVLRHGQPQQLHITPQVVQREGVAIGRIGAELGVAPAMVVIRHSVWESMQYGMQRTWEVARLTLKTLWRVATGQASLKNISGPITIADYAGRTAHAGWISFIVFIGLVSVSLGVLNLLPIPLLDGGHLMYYLWEMVTGKAVTDAWQVRFAWLGKLCLGIMMVIALFNDMVRLTG